MQNNFCVDFVSENYVILLFGMIFITPESTQGLSPIFLQLDFKNNFSQK